MVQFLRRVIAFLLIISLLWYLGGWPIPDPTWVPRIQHEIEKTGDRVRQLVSDDVRVLYNQQPLFLEPPPFLLDGTLMMPVRPIMESVGAGVQWDSASGAVVITRYDTTVQLIQQSDVMHVNGVPQTLPQAVQTVDGVLMAPARMLSDALSLGFEWQADRNTMLLTATPDQERVSVTLQNRTIALGDSLLSVQTRLGAPQRVDQSVFGFQWHVYNADYAAFMMIGYDNNRVQAVYTNSAGFIADGVAYGSIGATKTDHAYFYIDDLNGGTVHAALVAQSLDNSLLPHPPYDAELVHMQELENFDCVNAFRVANGLQPLVWNELAAVTGRQHSQDMADRAYFDHISPEGTRPWDRFEANGGVYRMIGENIYAGHFQGIDTYDGWINSADHREAILEPGFLSLGVGMGYSPDTEYKYYTTELFVR